MSMCFHAPLMVNNFQHLIRKSNHSYTFVGLLTFWGYQQTYKDPFFTVRNGQMHIYTNFGYNFKSSQGSEASLDRPGELLYGRMSLHRWNSGHQPLWEGDCGGDQGDPSRCEISHLIGSHCVFQNWSLKGCLGYRCRSVSWFCVVTDTNKNLRPCLNCRSCHLVVRVSPGIEHNCRGQRG